MAGVKGKSGGPRKNSGGARPGAGRKPKPAAVSKRDDPLEFLRGVWKGEIEANPSQVKAATAALPFVHEKRGEGGKKDKKAAAANKAGKGKFAPSRPPTLSVVK